MNRGQRYFLRLGCHPASIEETVEPSVATWMLAALFAREWMFGITIRTKGTKHFAGRCAIEGYPELAKQHTATIRGIIEGDRRALRTWLGYAKERLKKVERLTFVDALGMAWLDPDEMLARAGEPGATE